MAARICVKRVDATLENGVWTCPDAGLLRQLDALTRMCRRGGDRAGDDFEALWVANRIGGAVLPDVAAAPPVSPPRGP